MTGGDRIVTSLEGGANLVTSLVGGANLMATLEGACRTLAPGLPPAITLSCDDVSCMYVCTHVLCSCWHNSREMTISLIRERLKIKHRILMQYTMLIMYRSSYLYLFTCLSICISIYQRSYYSEVQGVPRVTSGLL